MKAVVMTAPGEPEVLSLQDIPPPILEGDHELLVRIHAAGVNPIDTKLRARGPYRTGPGPHVLGCDAAGVVEQVGRAVTRFQPGDEVYFCDGGLGGLRGNYAEYTLVDERFAARKPRNLDFVHAAAAPLVLITAWESLHERAHVHDGQRVLIHAGAGGVGHVAIQLARAAGARVCTTVSTAAKAEFVRSLGAEEVILYPEQDFVAAALAWTGGRGVDMALDTVGGPTFARSAEAVAVYGDLVTVLQPDAETDWREARLRSLRVSLELMLTPMLFGLAEAQARQARILERCAELFEQERLQVHVQQSFALENAAEAHRALARGLAGGKLVLEVA
ncbi:MAG TPA: alcohol dehydrogenase [Alphaproteobacteria bacterium]|nr:alcohol dehydrogenase [Alphaproteobacteria bacterium]